jgi:putative ABC transport system permease protein
MSLTARLLLLRAGLLRRRLRAAVTMAGVALAVALAFCLIGFQRGYQRALRTELDRLGAHVLVVPKGCPYDAASIALHGASWPCYLKSVYLQTVAKTPGVAVAAPILMTALYEEKTGAQTVYCGVEENIRQLKPFWQVQGAFPSKPGDLLVGAEAARTNRWTVGQTVTLPGMAKETGRISGILQPTQGPDDLFHFLRLEDAQRLFRHRDELTHILVRLKDPERMESVVRELRGCDAGLEMTVVPLAHLFQTIQNLIQNTRVLLACAALAALLAAGMGISNTMLMAVTERTREIGVLRATGIPRGTIFGLICAEALTLTLLGAILGLALATGGAGGFEAWLRERLPYAPRDTLLRPEPAVMAFCFTIAALLGMLAALLPATAAARLSPVEAIRRGAK